jgi:hypothetical protein
VAKFLQIRSTIASTWCSHSSASRTRFIYEEVLLVVDHVLSHQHEHFTSAHILTALVLEAPGVIVSGALLLGNIFRGIHAAHGAVRRYFETFGTPLASHEAKSMRGIHRTSSRQSRNSRHSAIASSCWISSLSTAKPYRVLAKCTACEERDVAIAELARFAKTILALKVVKKHLLVELTILAKSSNGADAGKRAWAEKRRSWNT